MSQPQPLQNNFTAGMRQDTPRDQIQQSSVWNAVNVLPNYEAALKQRGGWEYYCPALTVGTVKAGVFSTFSASAGSDQQNLALDSLGNLWKLSSSGVTAIGGARTVIQNPVFHGGTAASAATAVYTGLVIIPDGTGSQRPAKYDGTTITDLNGEPPLAKFAAVYKDYTLLANGTVGGVYFPNRIWFSPPGDPDCATAATAWDTTYSWLDISLPIEGIAATKNVVLVFHDGQVSRLRGSTPPPDEDMVVDDPLFNVGLLDPMSIATWKEMVLFASPQGVFRTDGVTLDNLALRGGMSRYWLDLVADNPGLKCSGGIIRDSYLLSVTDGSGALLDCFLIDLSTLAWVRLDNVAASCMWGGLDQDADELFWGVSGTDRIASASTLFSNVGSVFTDGDGTVVTDTIETLFFPLGRPGLKRLRRAFFGCSMGSSAAATLSYLTYPDGAYEVSEDALVNNGGYTRQKVDLNTEAFGVAFKIEKTGNGSFSLHDLEIEAWPLEGSRV